MAIKRTKAIQKYIDNINGIRDELVTIKEKREEKWDNATEKWQENNDEFEDDTSSLDDIINNLESVGDDLDNLFEEE